MLADLAKLLRPPHPLDNGESKGDRAYQSQVYEVRVRGWQWRINHTVLSIVGFCFILMMALSPTGLPMLGAIAWANPIEQKIQTAITPIQKKMEEISQQTQAIKDQQDEKDLADLRQKLFETRIAQCKARALKRGEAGPYTQRMGELQALHYKLTKTYYTPADCEDL